jgi:glycosyltransferase involved in cell wall biosynthesis
LSDGELPHVSIITPTYDRERFHPQIQHCFALQDYPALEWLILDDSPDPSRVLEANADPRVRYHHIKHRLSIGEKRNWLAHRARGEIILHFDDDDFYGCNYVSSLVAAMRESGADLLNLRGWFLYDCRHRFFGYWNLLIKEGVHYACDRRRVRPILLSKDNNRPLENNHLGFGFGWAYKKTVWRHASFPAVNWNEDGEFALKARASFRLEGLIDTRGICLHLLHGSNNSRSFPQFHLPNFLLPRYFSSLDAAALEPGPRDVPR